ncbi:MAG: hypothetical protein LBK27_07520 [Treponema sp.]|jgi:hypothetical protein|nr:hypothetical protein [Treponema sp.]
MRTKPFIAVLAFGVILASCASENFTFDGRIDLFSRYIVSPQDALAKSYAVIISEDGKRYNIWPKELEERIRYNETIKNRPIRFTLRPCKEIEGYGIESMDGIAAPLSWELLDSEGAVIKNHYLRKPRWGTWNKSNLDPMADIYMKMPTPLEGRFEPEEDFHAP